MRAAGSRAGRDRAGVAGRRRGRRAAPRRHARRLGHAAARELAPAPAPAAHGARRRAPAPAGARARHARRAPPAAPGGAARARRGAQGDPAAQPARLVELPHLPRLRQGLGVPAVRRRPRAAPRRGRASPATTAGTASASRRAATPAARPPSPATARARSGSRPSWPRRSTCPVFRLDADTAGTKDAVPALLARFAAAPAGLLVGTQMVAKGHDFPDVTLGVVVDADATLRFPDFRAEERTFALIAQLAGRAGRGPLGGRVLVQTTSPDAPAIAGRRAPRHGRLPGGGARAPAGAGLSALRRPDPRRLQRRRRRARRGPRRARSPRP